MKIPVPSRRLAGLLVGIALLSASIVWRVRRPAAPPAAHVQLVLASDGELLVAGVPGRTLRSRIQNPTVWDGSSTTSPFLVDWLRIASSWEKRSGSYDGRALVIVDDHASFQIAKMLIASARDSYPEVSYIDGVVTELPRPPAVSYVKDCSLKPPPPGCAKK